MQQADHHAMAQPIEERSFERIAAELSPALLRYLQRTVGERGLAEDLLQETLIRMARGLPGFAGRASLKTWAFAIATRAAADHFRDPGSRVRIVEMDEAEHVADISTPADERIVVDEMNSCVREVIDGLPEAYRAALVLHDLEDFTAGQVAGICNCSVATAKIRIHRARGRLKEALQQQCRFYRDGDEVFRCERKPP
jgi:RNA polymerase sigma-70 factor (ECF subfamily)